MPRILFFNPPLRTKVYMDTNVGVAAPTYPSLTLATLAGGLVEKHKVKIVDLDLVADYYATLFNEIRNFKPDIIASSATTPDYLVVKDIMAHVKRSCPEITTIVGGVHVTALPEETGQEDRDDRDQRLPFLLPVHADNSPSGYLSDAAATSSLQGSPARTESMQARKSPMQGVLRR